MEIIFRDYSFNALRLSLTNETLSLSIPLLLLIKLSSLLRILADFSILLIFLVFSKASLWFLVCLIAFHTGPHASCTHELSCTGLVTSVYFQLTHHIFFFACAEINVMDGYSCPCQSYVPRSVSRSVSQFYSNNTLVLASWFCSQSASAPLSFTAILFTLFCSRF